MVLPTLKRSAWNSHSESVLQTMLCSENREEREFAVATILQIRGNIKLGDLKPKARKHPDLNISATCLKDLINWKDAKEPVSWNLSDTINLSDIMNMSEIMNLSDLMNLSDIMNLFDIINLSDMMNY